MGPIERQDSPAGRDAPSLGTFLSLRFFVRAAPLARSSCATIRCDARSMGRATGLTEGGEQNGSFACRRSKVRNPSAFC